MIEELPEWLEKAEWDWRSAGDNLNLPQVNAGLVAFLCQQCNLPGGDHAWLAAGYREQQPVEL